MADDIIQFANENPKRVRNDQGEVETRSADDLIKLDKHQAKLNTNRFAALQNSIVRAGKYPDCTSS